MVKEPIESLDHFQDRIRLRSSSMLTNVKGSTVGILVLHTLGPLSDLIPLEILAIELVYRLNDSLNQPSRCVMIFPIILVLLTLGLRYVLFKGTIKELQLKLFL